MFAQISNNFTNNKHQLRSPLLSSLELALAASNSILPYSQTFKLREIMKPTTCLWIFLGALVAGSALSAPAGEHLPLPKDCGKSPLGKHRITGGEFAELGRFPSYVKIESIVLDGTPQKFGGTCGGAVISERLILTAAHCVVPTSKGNYSMKIDLAASRPENYTSSMPEYLVNSVCTPKHWINFMPARLDLAVLQLNRPLKFDKHTQPVCLSGQRRLDDKTQVFNIGMGLTETGDLAKKLKFLRAKREPCPAELEHESLLCTKFIDPKSLGGACQGDSGGPLIVEVEGRQTVFGVVSMGVLNCTSDLDRRAAYVDLYSTRDLVHQLLSECSQDLQL